MIPSYRVPAVLEQSANAPGVDSQAIEIHNRLNSALERGDTMEALRLMRELKAIVRTSETIHRIHTIEVQNAGTIKSG